MSALPLLLLVSGCAESGAVDPIRGGRAISGTLAEGAMHVQGRSADLWIRTTHYGTTALGSGRAQPGCPEATAIPCIGRGARLVRPMIEEWWTAHPTGLEHGWLLLAPPAAGDVSLTVEMIGASAGRMEADGTGIRMGGPSGAWRYHGLQAWDAAGTALAATMAAVDGAIVIRVRDPVPPDRWPVVIDPILSSTFDLKLTASDAAASDYFGSGAAGAGDFDGDGYEDLAVGAGGDDDEGASAGAAYVYYGSAAGVVVSSEVKITASDAMAGDGFGAVASAGDVNGDGYGDLLVAAQAADRPAREGGAAYLYLGSSTGLDASTEQFLVPANNDVSDYFGYSVSGAGDINGDGLADIAASAPFTDRDSISGVGSVYTFLGSGTGIDASSEQEINPSVEVERSWFGGYIAGAGDVDGDGYADLVVGAFGDDELAQAAGAAYIYYGATAGIDVSREQRVLASDGARLDAFGSAVAGPGDLDGDGFADVAIGASADSDNGGYASGAVYIFHGSAAGLDATSEVEILASDGAAGDLFGEALFGADFDADGFADLLVGASRDDDAGSKSGSAYVYYGSGAGLDQASEIKLTATDGAADDEFGRTVGAGDFDGDGYADAVVGTPYDDDGGSESGSVYVFSGTCRDEDGDGACREDDCDDADATSSPSSTEICDAADNDCDGTTDEPDAVDAAIWYADADGDGYGDAIHAATACEAPTGYVADATDCDDGTNANNPAATEVCDATDNDCDGTADEPDAADAATWYADADADGYGDAASATTACSAPTGYVADATDCDDGTNTNHPAATEVCDAADNDCDGTTDEPDAADAATWYADADADGYGDATHATAACEAPTGYVADATDCDDGTNSNHPAATEVCDATDNDCDGTADEPDSADAATWYSDADGDGYGDATHATAACEAPTGYVEDATDCDDGTNTNNPAATEVCDAADNDCDGTTDEGCAEPPPDAVGCSGCAQAGVATFLANVLAALALAGRARRNPICSRVLIAAIKCPSAPQAPVYVSERDISHVGVATR